MTTRSFQIGAVSLASFALLASRASNAFGTTPVQFGGLPS